MFKVVLKLRSNYLLQHLGQEGEVGDSSLAGKNVWVQDGLLEEGRITATLRADGTLPV